MKDVINNTHITVIRYSITTRLCSQIQRFRSNTADITEL